MSTVALVTCARFADLDPDDRLLIEPLAVRGVSTEAVAWDDGVDWRRFDVAVLRSTWDYPPRREEFLGWTRRVPRLRNPADIVAWNTDKAYLTDLARAGVPVVPTDRIAPAQSWRLPDEGEFVVKPAVGAGSLDAGRYRADHPADRSLAAAHVARLQAAARHVLVQPYLAAVDTYGETSLLFIADPATGDLAYSHAIRKGPMLDGPHVATPELYKEERISSRAPSAAERAVARLALTAVPGGTRRLLYARVDLIPGPDGQPLLVELELTEPSLFLGTSAGAADRLAAAIVAVSRSGPG